MKTYLKVIICSIIVGGIIAFIFYKDIKNDVIAITKNKDTIYLFQVGVYKNLNNANNKLNEYPANIVLYNDNYYHVISSICYSESTCNILKTYFNDLNINYYLKKYYISANYIKELNNYEEILSKTENKDVILNINKKINTLFLEYIS